MSDIENTEKPPESQPATAAIGQIQQLDEKLYLLLGDRGGAIRQQIVKLTSDAGDGLMLMDEWRALYIALAETVNTHVARAKGLR